MPGRPSHYAAKKEILARPQGWRGTPKSIIKTRSGREKSDQARSRRKAMWCAAAAAAVVLVIVAMARGW